MAERRLTTAKERRGDSLTGIYKHAIDAKGRLFIPARLREELGEVFYVTLSMEKCLSLYSSESWERFSEKTKAMPKAKQIKMRPLFAHADKCELDGQGRILLSQIQRTFAGLSKNVTVVGVGECAEVWDSDTWVAVDEAETTPENIADVFMELDF
ncbi:MAG: division/cell wall cluster transcriptional repressor MraZ [Oscillospiraceae bacterium]|nr:division/cell wall cluster transcriptional repressor MraZ [Oscillospiraceae bacterium]